MCEVVFGARATHLKSQKELLGVQPVKALPPSPLHPKWIVAPLTFLMFLECKSSVYDGGQRLYAARSNGLPTSLFWSALQA